MNQGLSDVDHRDPSIPQGMEVRDDGMVGLLYVSHIVGWVLQHQVIRELVRLLARWQQSPRLEFDEAGVGVLLAQGGEPRWCNDLFEWCA